MEEAILTTILKKLSSKPRSKLGSSDPVDAEIFDKVSRLYYESNTHFFRLKKLLKARLSSKDPATYLLMAYFYYADCDFEEALSCFKEFLKFNEDDLEASVGIVFCYRQLGQEEDFAEQIKAICGKIKS